MTSLLDALRSGNIPPEIGRVAEQENTDPDRLSRHIIDGKAVIMRRGDIVRGIGKDLSTKVNVNLGASSSRVSLKDEVAKAVIAERFGADTISDLSMGGDISVIRDAILRHTTIPMTTVPVYQAVAEHGLEGMTTSHLLETILEQARQGVSSMVMHFITGTILDMLAGRERIMGVVSKGGSMTAAFMLLNQCENPLITHFDEILTILRDHDIVLSLGNSARSGCVHDPMNAAQQEELRQNVELAHYAHRHGVQVIIEGAGGHIRYDRIPAYIRMYKESSPFPLFVAGPIPTDIGVGYDHIASSVGASAASSAGADYLCAITPAEHLGLPTADHIREGLIACRIAAHIGDIVKYGNDAPDRIVAEQRAHLDREAQVLSSMDTAKAREIAGDEKECTMCGDYCAIRLMQRYLYRE
jgi:Thiamine biosynthesis protein ThiC